MKMASKCEIEACGAPQGLSNSTFFSDVDQAREGDERHLYILSDNFRQAGTTQLTDVRLWGGSVQTALSVSSSVFCAAGVRRCVPFSLEPDGGDPRMQKAMGDLNLALKGLTAMMRLICEASHLRAKAAQLHA
jgi:hypothetical protein